MQKWKFIVLVVVLAAAAGGAFVGLRRDTEPSADAALADISLRVDVSERRLYVERNGEVDRSYRIAVGSAKYRTPRGTFTVNHLIWNPRWVPPDAGWAKKKTAKAPGEPGNPMGRVKIFFKEPDYYIHGTNDGESIGQAASHGCVRMLNGDVMELGQLLIEEGEANVSEGLIRRLIDRVRQTRNIRLQRGVRMVVET